MEPISASRINHVLKMAAGTPVAVNGWVRTRRDSKGGFSFVELNDGSCLKSLQIIADGTLDNYESEVLKLGVGASISASGVLVESPGKGQSVELKAQRIVVLGAADASYPLQKKGHSMEFLRTIAHLRPRTNAFGCMARIRNRLAAAVHEHFQSQGFLWVHTPIITGSDAEGAGALFQVTTLDVGAAPRDEHGQVDYKQDFFGRRTSLTVSGQLEGEAWAMALGDIYTFGPTFRAENSNTTRHLAEFWMIEPEMAFADLARNAEVAEAFLKATVKSVLESCADDVAFLDQRVQPGLTANLEQIVNSPFERMTYTEAVGLLEKSGMKFDNEVRWGLPLQTEHERWLTEEQLKKPVILTDYPKDIAAFYMRLNDDGKTVRAMDVLVPQIGEIIGGSQREERHDVLAARLAANNLAAEDYWWYLELRKFGTAQHAGFGLGFERLVLLATGMGNIRDVIPFPRTPKHAEFLMARRAAEQPEQPEHSPGEELLELIGKVPRGGDIPRKNRVFVNRNLRMDQIDLIGFDMDYTLAIYDQSRIEALSIACTVEKLVRNKGYPEDILGLDYDPQSAIRGLVVDRFYGNVLKMDRYGHVGRAYHGRAELGREEKRSLYRMQRIRLSTPRYAMIDTLFALPEAVMFARMVELLESKHEPVIYKRLWSDIREAIDEAHRDDSIKRVIKADIGAFIDKDPELAATLHKFRSAGKRLFVLTNSMWDYTDAVMTYLLEGALAAYPSWRNYFDIVVVSGSKPAFFTDRLPFIELDASGAERGPAHGPLQRGRIYQGGNLIDFEANAGAGGDRVLYIGDHIYGDMLRAKKSSVWRTAMIVQELEDELAQVDRNADKIRHIDRQELQRARLESEIGYQQHMLRSLQRFDQTDGSDPPAGLESMTLAEARRAAKGRLEQLRDLQRKLGEDVDRLEEEVERAFNPWWGQIFKEGVENSRFGEQVEDYACVYTSRVSNFLAYSPLQYFRSPRDFMPHELP